MARKESVQRRLEKVRPPRVQLTYEVEVGGAIERKEIPFVAGVLGDFTGKPAEGRPPTRLKDRKFVGIDLETFDDVMQGMCPGANFRVRNRLGDQGGEFTVRLRFDAMDDFRPESVVQQIEPLRRLLEVRTRLADLRNKLAGNEQLEDVLAAALADAGQLGVLEAEMRKKVQP